MKSLYKYFCLFITLTFLFRCSDLKTKSTTNESTNLAENKSQATLPLLDSTIRIQKINRSKHIDALSKKIAEDILYSYFDKKGIMSKATWQLKSSFYKNEVVVDYDTIYTLNSSTISGAIVSYWLGPGDLNGHCFQTSKALLLSSGKGYELVEENIIPSSYTIDSVRGNFIFGYDYECGGRGVLRQFKIELK